MRTEAGDSTTAAPTKKAIGTWIRKNRIALLVVVGVVALAGMSGLLLFAGFQVYRHEVEPFYTTFDKVDRRIERTFFRIPPRLEDKIYSTALLNLQADVAIVDMGRSGDGGPMANNGGGLAPFGKDVLLLPYDGWIYAAHDSGSLRKTGIQGPDNNRTAFQALANDDNVMSKYQFDFTYLRYNDLEAFDTGQRRGLIASYSEYHPERQCYTNSLAVLDIDRSMTSIDQVQAGPQNWRVLFRTAPCLSFKTDGLALEGQMAGGRIAFAAPSTIYLTSGDYHFDSMRSEGQPIAQDPEAQYGKILKIDLETGVGQVVSMGHRNPQGIAVLEDGRVLSIEHGPQGGDELNLIRPGANYGWPRESYGTTYRGTAIPNAISYGRHETFEQPLISWVPSITASAITVVRGFDPAWEGDLLVGSLVDMSLHRVRLVQDRVAYSERIPVGSRVRDVMQHPDGRIVMWTDNEELIFLSSAPKTDEHAQLEDFLDDAPISDATKERVRDAVDRCSECHSFAVGEDARSPSLARVYSAEVASTGYQNYSPALKSKSGRWTTENLRAFLSDPAEFAPGTNMPDPQLPDAMTRDALVDYLQRRRRDF